MNFWLELTVSALLMIGGIFVLVGSIGLFRLKDAYTRLHAPTKATTVGLGGVLLSSVIYMSHLQGYINVHALLITLFLVITAPVTAHILAKVAMHHKVKTMKSTQNEGLVEKAREQKAVDDEASASNSD